jgi:hypothetical protein
MQSRKKIHDMSYDEGRARSSGHLVGRSDGGAGVTASNGRWACIKERGTFNVLAPYLKSRRA